MTYSKNNLDTGYDWLIGLRFAVVVGVCYTVEMIWYFIMVIKYIYYQNIMLPYNMMVVDVGAVGGIG